MKPPGSTFPLQGVQALASLCLLALAACQAPFGLSETVVGSGNIVEQERVLPEFDRIKLKGAMNLEIEVGPEASLWVVGDDNLQEHLQSRVRGGELILEVERRISSREEFVARVSLPALERLRIAGRSEIAVRGVDTKVLRIEANGSCFGKVSGVVDEVVVEIAGAGRLDLSELPARIVDIVITGSGTLECEASEALRVEVSGSASVSYYGDPELAIEELGTLHLVQKSR